MELNEELKQTLADCYTSTKLCAKVLFPERFTLPFSASHDKIFNALNDDSIQKVAIAAPRGFGKTSIINLAYPAKKILYRDKTFIVPVSCTATQAVMQSENLKRELLTNSIINKIFGSVKPQPGNPISDFSKEAWVTDSGTLILPRGAGQQIRGIIFGNNRPDLILIDDLEDPEGVTNEESRKKLKEWFFADVMNSVNKPRKDWKIVVLGTLLHEGSLLSDLLADPSWHPIRLELFDDNYKSAWPEFMNDQQIIELVEEYRSQGMLDVLYREFRNLCISTEDATFKQSYFRYYSENEVDFSLQVGIENVVIIDPAKTVKLHSAESAIVGIGLDLANSKIYIRDLVAAKLHPDELYDQAIDMCTRLHARVMAVEVTSLHDFITYPLRNAIVAKNKVIELVELSAVGKKEDRASWLVPFYRKGQVYHNKGVTGPLEAQLLSFPRSKRWDCIDATAYVVKLLEEGERYFFAKVDHAPEEEFMKLRKEDEGELEFYPEDDDYGEKVIRKGSWQTI
jgi:hypothetical protein